MNSSDANAKVTGTGSQASGLASAAIKELVEAAKGLSFGAYPAHGSGFVCIVEGDLARFQQAVAAADRAAQTANDASGMNQTT